MKFVSLNDIWGASLDQLRALIGNKDEKFIERYQIDRNYLPHIELLKAYRKEVILAYAYNKQVDYLTYYFVTSPGFDNIMNYHGSQDLNDILSRFQFLPSTDVVKDHDLRYAGL